MARLRGHRKQLVYGQNFVKKKFSFFFYIDKVKENFLKIIILSVTVKLSIFNL